MAVRLEDYRGGKTRHICPACGKRGKFTRYIVVETGEYIADNVGRCNREQECGYHYAPKNYYRDNPSNRESTYVPIHQIKPREVEKPVSFIPNQFLESSMSVPYNKNNLFRWMAANFGTDATKDTFLKYMIGTSATTIPGATAYWQIDFQSRVRQCKVIQYNPFTGKRDKSIDARFMGKKLLNYQDIRLEQCFFGEHLLSEYENSTVAIVEAEKTAIICSIVYPDMVWLATGGKTSGCKWKSETATVCKPLEGKSIVLFPDLGATDEWKARAEILRKKINCKVLVSEELESIATDEQKAAGLDLADFIIEETISK